jgi:NAD-dependent deacetylase
MSNDLGKRIETLAKSLFKARYPVFFTGAGISTESGLPDFRGPDGLWTRRDKGLPPKTGDRLWEKADPNSGHMALVELQKMGKLKFLISQNIDNLHLRSGIPFDLMAELHGNINRQRCRKCQRTFDRSLGKKICDCGGALVSSVVDFGQSLPAKDLSMSFEQSTKSDLFVVVGSSLVVTPAANMPMEALRAGAKLVIINAGETPFDTMAYLRFQEQIGEVLPPVVQHLRILMGRD